MVILGLHVSLDIKLYGQTARQSEILSILECILSFLYSKGVGTLQRTAVNADNAQGRNESA